MKRDIEERSADHRLADSVQALVELRKNAPSNGDDPPNKLKYYSMYLNLDRMLCKLPEADVEELNVEFIRMIYDKLKSK